MNTLQLTQAITFVTAGGDTVELALLVIPEDAWDVVDEEPLTGGLTSPADKAIIEARREGWAEIEIDSDGYVEPIDTSVLTFWRRAVN